jgi:hypothetical protein
LVESFFGKMAKTLLRGVRVASADELKARIELYLREVNQTPVAFRWKYKLETLAVAQGGAEVPPCPYLAGNGAVDFVMPWERHRSRS